MSHIIQVTLSQHNRIVEAIQYALVVAKNHKSKLNMAYNRNTYQFDISAVQVAIVEVDREIVRLELLLEELNNLV